jgi:hypothetical protein
MGNTAMPKRAGAPIVVVYEGQEYHSAASELAHYAQQITGKQASLISGCDSSTTAKETFVVGPPGANSITRMLDEYSQGRISSALRQPQAIVVWPVAHNGNRFVVLAGANPITTLWAVYAYLEEFCHVGFFQDGEHIPMGELVFDGKPLVSAPRFVDRSAPPAVGTGHWGLKKFYPRFWTLDEIKRDLSWAAKRRLNMTIAPLGVTSGLTDEVARRACEATGYPIGPPAEEVLDVSGFPTSWSWPIEMRTRMTQEALADGRSLGIRFVYSIAPGQVPLEFRAKYPDFQYVKAERWSHAEIHPDDPFYAAFTKQYLHEVIDAFGTDHLYCASPYCETSPEGTEDENFELKRKAGLHFIGLLKEVDPDAVWVTDSWDFFWSRETWTAERVKAYLDEIPRERLYIYDTNADNRGVPVYREHGYFHGKDWAFGIMHSAAGLDQIHGDMRHVLSELRHVATDPKAKRCRGVWLVPELTHYNVMYYDFLTRAAWDPVGLDLDEFFGDYALRRYGATSALTMRRAIAHVADALQTREVNVPVYNLATLKWIWHNAPPWIQQHTVPRLRQAIRIALDERERQRDNPLYENDLVSIAKAYLAELAGYHFHRAHAAYAASDAAGLHVETLRCLAAIEWIGKTLSTRPDYSLGEMIAEVMSVAGTNPNTPRMILRGTVNWDYCANDSYEQVANYDLPRMAAYLAGLRERLDAGGGPIDMWKTVEGLSPTHDEWVNGDKTLRRAVVFNGRTLDAVVEAFETCSAAAPRALLDGRPLRRGRTVAWREDFSSADHWQSGEPGARLDGNVISSDPAFGPTGTRMHKEWVDMPVWGTMRTTAAADLASVDLKRTPLLTIRYRIETGEDPIHLWANWNGPSGKPRKTRVWRSFAPRGKWATDTVDLLLALRSQAEEPTELLSLEFATQRCPHEFRIERLEISG